MLRQEVMMNQNTKEHVQMEKDIIKALYQEGAIANNTSAIAKRTGYSESEIKDILPELENTLGNPFVVVDPRHIGYSYPSYTFIEMGDNLERGFRASRNDFNNPDKTMLLGTVLGDTDLIHRRVDEDKWANADFAKWAKNRLSYFEKFETYPIFQIARWHGKNIREPVNDDPPILSQSGKDAITALRDEPSLIREIKQSSGDDDINLPSPLHNYGLESAGNIIEELQEDEILLGTSRTFNINSSPWNLAIMGLALGDKSEPQGDPPKMELSPDHDKVISELQDLDTEFIDRFHMPFITSGVGQSWADILIEIRFEKNHHLDSIAETIRDIDYVETTRTHLMANEIFNSELESPIRN